LAKRPDHCAGIFSFRCRAGPADRRIFIDPCGFTPEAATKPARKFLKNACENFHDKANFAALTPSAF
jgi:hypothetical protein